MTCHPRCRTNQAMAFSWPGGVRLPTPASTSKRLLIHGATLLLVIGLFFVWATRPEPWHHERQVQALVQAVDAFRARTGRLPDAGDEALMRSLGFDYVATGPRPLYEPVDSSHFELSFVTGFDGPCWRYSSLTKNWREGCSK